MWMIGDDKYAKMEAAVHGKVLSTDGSEMTVECKNGRLVKVTVDPIDEFKCVKFGKKGGIYNSVPKKAKELTEKTVIGNKVEIEGWCYCLDGELAIFAEKIEIYFRNGAFALYSI